MMFQVGAFSSVPPYFPLFIFSYSNIAGSLLFIDVIFLDDDDFQNYSTGSASDDDDSEGEAMMDLPEDELGRKQRE